MKSNIINLFKLCCGKYVVGILGALFIISTLTSLNSCNKDEEIIVNDSTFSQKVSVVIQRVINDQNIPGVTLYLQNSEGEIFNEGLGLADVENNISMLGNTKVRIASISKTYLATVVLQLWEEQALDIDHLMSHYLPDDIVNMFPYGENVTIRQLLNMTSGIYDFEDESFIEMLIMNQLYPWTPLELLQHAVNSPTSKHELPGTIYGYSNTNYILLGLIVENITNLSMEQNIRNRILVPLELENTYCGKETIPQDNYAKGYQVLDETTTIIADDQRIPLDFEWAHGQMVATAPEVGKFFKSLIEGDLFQKNSTLQALMAFTPLSGFTYSFALDNIEGINAYGHNGSTVGFVSFASYNPTDNITIVCACNTGDMVSLSLVLGEIIKLIE